MAKFPVPLTCKASIDLITKTYQWLCSYAASYKEDDTTIRADIKHSSMLVSWILEASVFYFLRYLTWKRYLAK